VSNLALTLLHLLVAREVLHLPQTMVLLILVLVAAVELEALLAVTVVQGLLFFVTHQTTTWLQQAEQSHTSVVTRFIRSPLQVITRWWSHEQGCAYSSFDFGWGLGW
jgi:hypothetical protein